MSCTVCDFCNLKKILFLHLLFFTDFGLFESVTEDQEILSELSFAFWTCGVSLIEDVCTHYTFDRSAIMWSGMTSL